MGRPKPRRGTTSVELAPLALIARLAALVPPPRRHTVLYCGVISSHAASRKDVVPLPPVPEAALAVVGQDKTKGRSKYIRWSELLRRLISLIKSEAIAKTILTAMHLPLGVPELQPSAPATSEV